MNIWIIGEDKKRFKKRLKRRFPKYKDRKEFWRIAKKCAKELNLE